MLVCLERLSLRRSVPYWINEFMSTKGRTISKVNSVT